MKFQACRSRERALSQDDAGARICRVKRQRDQRLLVVGVRFFVDEREDEASWWFDRTESSTDVEDIPIWRLHSNPVIRSLHRTELEARHGESCGAPPTPKLLGVDECGEDELPRYDKDLLQAEPRLRRLLRFGHAVDYATAPSGVIAERWPPGRGGTKRRYTAWLSGKMERTGIEPVTFGLQSRRSPS
jgi:hypothetical protein